MVQFSEVKCSVVKFSGEECSVPLMQRSRVKNCILYSAVQCSTVHCSIMYSSVPEYIIQ